MIALVDKEQPPSLCPGAAGLFGGPELHSATPDLDGALAGWAAEKWSLSCMVLELWEGLTPGPGKGISWRKGMEGESYVLYIGPGRAVPWAQQHLVLYM